MARPRAAQAKVGGEDTRQRQAYAPDGRHVYSDGYARLPDLYSLAACRGLGLQRIVVERRTFVAETLADARIDFVQATPDGRELYILGPREPAAFALSPGPYVPRRLDARTLTVLAKREPREPRFPRLRPAVRDED